MHTSEQGRSLWIIAPGRSHTGPWSTAHASCFGTKGSVIRVFWTNVTVEPEPEKRQHSAAGHIGAGARFQAGEMHCHAIASVGMLTAVITAHESTDATIVIPVSVRDLLPRDLPACTWSGSATHLRQVERALARATAGEVDYLAVCTPVDLPVAIGGIDYQVSEGAGTLWQLAVSPALQSCGLGTLLIRAAEQRIRNRGLRRAELAVEENNPRARALYERLGYAAYGCRPDAWDEEGPDGSIHRHETVCVLLRKNL
jgi:ribosomal protein S18 acetylase RimI-like enzyme